MFAIYFATFGNDFKSKFTLEPHATSMDETFKSATVNLHADHQEEEEEEEEGEGGGGGEEEGNEDD